jgi:hypothetical protein
MNTAERQGGQSRRRGHFSLGQALGLVSVVALALAATRQATEVWLQVSYALALVVLTLGFLGVLLRTRPYGARVGFTVFGWGCFLLFFVIHDYSPFSSVFDRTFDGLTSLVHKAPAPPSFPQGVNPNIVVNKTIYELTQDVLDSNSGRLAKDYWAKKSLYDQRTENAHLIGKLFTCLIVGFFGSIAGRLLAARREPIEGVR